MYGFLLLRQSYVQHILHIENVLIDGVVYRRKKHNDASPKGDTPLRCHMLAYPVRIAG